MDITVAICTWNRARRLESTLRAMTRLQIPQGVAWELLVVNNHCTDDTDIVLERFAQRLPLHRLYEARQGLSRARNCALEAAQGALLVWTDDDVLVDADWLAEYHRAARDWPEAGYFGGTVDPLYELDPPPWACRHPGLVEGAFALRQLGPEIRPLKPGEFPFGANMAFRRHRLGGRQFDPQLGRVGREMLSGDETEVFQRLAQAGTQGVWVGTARVRHFVPRERLTTRYLWRYLAGLGATDLRRRQSPPTDKCFLGMPRWMIKRHVIARFNAAMGAWRKDQRWAAAFKEAAFTRGFLAACIARRRGRLPLAPSAPPATAQPTASPGKNASVA